MQRFSFSKGSEKTRFMGIINISQDSFYEKSRCLSIEDVMKLAEIVRGEETSEETVDTVVSLAKSAGKNPIVINDNDSNWGYVTNRVYFAMVKEASAVVEEGIADREQVDQLMTDCFRWPSGPFGMTRGATSGWK